MKRTAMPKRKKAMARKKAMKRTRTPMSRKAPARKATRKVPARKRPAKPRARIKPVNKKRRPSGRRSAQRAACMLRDGERCQFRIPVGARRRMADGWYQEEYQCTVTGADNLVAAHVWRRTAIAHPPTADHPDVVVAACDTCHKRFDDKSRRKGLRLPIEAVDRARARINAHRTEPRSKLQPLPDDAQP